MTIPDTTRQTLIDAAGPLFAEKGWKATRVREITQRAGTNVAAVHYHFGDVESLYTEAVRHAAESCLKRVPMPNWPAGTPAPQRLRDFIHTLLERVVIDREPAWLPQLILRELTQPTPACSTFVRDFVRPTAGVLHGILRELLPDDLPEEKLWLCAFSVIGQCLHYRFTRPVIRQLLGEERFQALDVETLTDHIYEFSSGAVRSVAARHRRRETV